MDRIEFLVEEASMAELLRVILPRVLSDTWKLGSNCFIRPHEGKSDLRRSIPNKFKGLGRCPYLVGFVIVQDQDSNDCKQLKQELVSLCEANKAENTSYIVRIVCHELEAWYIGDVNAIHSVFPRFHIEQHEHTAMFRSPDNCVNPKSRLKNIVGDYSQINTAKQIGRHLDVENNKSESFNQFVSGVLRLAEQS